MGRCTPSREGRVSQSMNLSKEPFLFHMPKIEHCAFCTTKYMLLVWGKEKIEMSPVSQPGRGNGMGEI